MGFRDFGSGFRVLGLGLLGLLFSKGVGVRGGQPLEPLRIAAYLRIHLGTHQDVRVRVLTFILLWSMSNPMPSAPDPGPEP